jgi:hypothetical protein
LVKYIENVGMNNIVQICIDNVSSMQNVVDLIIHCFLGLYFQGCVIHYFDFLLEDWGKKTWVKLLFLSYNNALLVIFCHYETNLMFPNLNETQFTTNFLMVEWLFKLSFLLFTKLLWIHYRQPLSITWHPSSQVPHQC